MMFLDCKLPTAVPQKNVKNINLVVRANGVSELEIFRVLQSERSHFSEHGATNSSMLRVFSRKICITLAKCFSSHFKMYRQFSDMLKMGSGAYGQMTFYCGYIWRANEVSEPENFCILQSEKSYFSEYSIETFVFRLHNK